MKRRNFILKSGAAMAVPFLPSFSLYSGFEDKPEKLLQDNLPVNFTRDGLNLSPKLYSELLQQLTQKENFKPDSYGLKGMIHKFEEKVASSLGKEKAVYMPTGTLANHIALRKHCINKKRAIIQYNSHINRDTGDCVSNISGINLLTLGKDKVIFDNSELQTIIEENNLGKVKTPIGVLSLETPVRRNHLKRIPFKNIEKIVEIARKNNIATHLDGARLFIDAAFSGKKINDYTSLFDTVYLSLYKSFNSIGGAILAGSKEFIEDLHHQRRMFGGTLPSSWQQIAVANYFFDNYEERYKNTLERFKILKSKLEASGKFKIVKLPYGSNIVKLIPLDISNVNQFKTSLANSKIYLPNWNKKDKCFYIKINDSLVYNDIDDISNTFMNSI